MGSGYRQRKQTYQAQVQRKHCFVPTSWESTELAPQLEVSIPHFSAPWSPCIPTTHMQRTCLDHWLSLRSHELRSVILQSWDSSWLDTWPGEHVTAASQGPFEPSSNNHVGLWLATIFQLHWTKWSHQRMARPPNWQQLLRLTSVDLQPQDMQCTWHAHR